MLGEAGVGKSYLVDAFQVEVGTATTVLRGRCLPYGDGITFWPLVEVLRAAAAIADDDSPDEAHREDRRGDRGRPPPPRSVTGSRASPACRPPASPSPSCSGAPAVPRGAVAKRPVVLFIDDIHSAEETFLDLLDHLLDATAPQSAVLIVRDRPHVLSEKRPDWASRPSVRSSRCRPLERGRRRGGSSRCCSAARSRPRSRRGSSRASEGNPLFVEQLVSMLVEKGLHPRARGHLAAVGRPRDSSPCHPRSRRCSPPASTTCRARSGRSSSPPQSSGCRSRSRPSRSWSRTPLRTAVPAHLRALLDASSSSTASRATRARTIYRFRHLMIRDAIYGSPPQAGPRELHERFVTWAERVNRERGREQEFEEILGYHLEQAYRYRTELGPLDADGRAIAERAATKLANAGRRASSRGDLPASVSLLKRAAAVLRRTIRRRLGILFDLGEAMIGHGALEDARALIIEGLRIAEQLGDERLRRADGDRRADARPVHRQRAARRSRSSGRKAIIKVLERYDDDFALARAWNEVTFREITRGQYEAATVASDMMVAHARARRQRAPRGPGGARPSRTSWSTAQRRCRKGSAAATSYSTASGATAARRRSSSVPWRSSRRWTASSTRPASLCERVRGILTELQARIDANSTSIEASRGRDPGRRPRGRRGDAPARRRGPRRRSTSSTSARRSPGILANVLALRGTFADAERYAALAESLSDEEDLEAQIAWRTARAKVLAHTGAAEEAVALAQQAVDLASEGEDLPAQGRRAHGARPGSGVVGQPGIVRAPLAGGPEHCTKRRATGRQLLVVSELLADPATA